MGRLWCVTLAVIAWLAGLLTVCPVAAALPETIDALRPSLVVVGSYQRTRRPPFRPLGTGFAVDDGSIVATNAHVIPATLDSGQMEGLAVALPAGPGTVQVNEAVVVAVDKTHDLVVLRMKGRALPPLRLAEADGVREGQSVAFSGFPIPTVLGLFTVTHRGIIAAISPIGVPRTSSSQLDPSLIRNLAGGSFNVYALDAPAYPGHSGSPVYLPDSGEVVAVINSTFVKDTKESVLTAPSGISYAIPIRYLRELIRTIGVR